MNNKEPLPSMTVDADAPTPDAPVVQLPIDAVSVGRRMRLLNQAAVLELAESMAEQGLLHPITVSTDGRLIAGLHRLEAAKLLGWDTIPARVVAGGAEELELLEIDENLVRAQLTALERAEHLERRRDLYRSLHPDSGRGGGPGRGHRGPQQDRAAGFAAATSSVIGQGESTVHRHLQIVARLPQDVRDLIRGTPASDSWKELGALAKLPPDEQRAVAERIASSEVRHVWEAQRLVRLAHAQTTADGVGSDAQSCKLMQCRIADLHLHVPAESVDLIVTDPPYGADAIAAYGELARFGRHALTASGSMLVMVGQMHLPAILEQLTDHLTYQWILAYVVDAGGSPVVPTVQRRVNSWWKPLIWLTRDGYDGPVHGDLIRSGPKVKEAHVWQQDVEGMEFLVGAFSLPGQTVCDPFVGSGTTGIAARQAGRRFVGADSDADAISLARARFSASARVEE